MQAHYDVLANGRIYCSAEDFELSISIIHRWSHNCIYNEIITVVLLLCGGGEI